MRVFVLGEGRIALAVRSLLGVHDPARDSEILTQADEIADADLLISTLPGGLGLEAVDTALAQCKDLIDIADLDPTDYFRRQKEIASSGIRLIAGCGFSPGLVSSILGYEASTPAGIEEVEAVAGSTSPRPHYFPFLWCFEDLVAEFMSPSLQVVDSRVQELPAFAGHRVENILGFEVETYFAQSGFENLAAALPCSSFVFRTCRPVGFNHFFRYLDSYGYFAPENMESTKAALEARMDDNATLARITLHSGSNRIEWGVKAEASASDDLNSMQRVTAGFAVAVAQMLAAGALPRTGLIFAHELATACGRTCFGRLLDDLRRQGIAITREESE